MRVRQDRLPRLVARAINLIKDKAPMKKGRLTTQLIGPDKHQEDLRMRTSIGIPLVKLKILRQRIKEVRVSRFDESVV